MHAGSVGFSLRRIKAPKSVYSGQRAVGLRRSARKRTLVHLRAETLRAEKIGALSDPAVIYGSRGLCLM